MSEFEGRTALVTGGGSGIGRAIALAFAKKAANVVVSDVDDRGGTETARTIQSDGGESTFVRADVTHAKDVETLVALAVEQYGRLDFGVNNAGIVGAQSSFAELSEEVWDQVIGINLKGVFLCMQHEIRHMLAQGGGAIVNIASVCGLVATAGGAAYTASKHGVNGITKAVALEYAPRGIRINSVCPGVIETPLVARLKTESDGAFEQFAFSMTPMGRLGLPEEIAAAVAWLCSDAASFVTGAHLTVDGGYTSQ